MATNVGLRGHSVQFSNLREATAGKGKEMSAWRGQGNKIGNPQRQLSTFTPGKSGGMEGGEVYCCK